MKKLLLSTFAFCLCTFSFAQQYGWVDISANVSIESGDLISDVYFIDENTGWITTLLEKKVFFTDDGGATFRPQETEYNTQLTTIFMINKDYGFCAGYNGIIYKTTNGGADWKYHGTMGGGTITDIDFPPNPTMESIGYLTGQNGSVYRISDSGINKIELNISSNIDAVSLISENEAWICGEYVIKHLINDVDQSDQSYSKPGSIISIYFLPGTTTGFCVGDAGEIKKTTDGMDWQTKKNPVSEEQILYDVNFIDENTGWVVGTSGTIMKSTDGGETWIKEESGTENTLGKIFPVGNIVYACGGESTLLKYTKLTPIAETSLSQILINNEVMEGFEASTLTYTITLSSGSEAPDVDATPSTNGATIQITQASEIPGTATITVTSPDGSSSSTYTINFTINTAIDGFRQRNELNVFPNPAKNKFRVQSLKFKVEGAQVEVIDITGKKYLEKQIEAGNELVEVDVSSLQSGIYFCKIRFKDECVTRKIIIQK